MFCMLKNKNILLMFQDITQIVKKKSYSFNDFKRGKIMALSCCKKAISIIRRNNGDFYCLNCLRSFATEKKLESHKKGM